MRNSLISFSVLICKTGDNTHLPTSPEITGNQVVAFKPYMHSPARSGCSLCACFCRVSSDPSGCDGSCAGEEGRTVTAATGPGPIGSRAPSSPAPCSSRPRAHCQGRGGGGHTAQDRPLRETGCPAAAKAAGHVHAHRLTQSQRHRGTSAGHDCQPRPGLTYLDAVFCPHPSDWHQQGLSGCDCGRPRKAVGCRSWGRQPLPISNSLLLAGTC